MLESGVTFSLAQLVMDNEITSMVRETVRGILINEESMAVEAIKQAGPGGSFMAMEHTLQHMREQSQPELINRKRRDSWKSDGGKNYAERAKEKAISILKTHKPEPLPEKVISELRSIVHTAQQELVKKENNQ